MFKKCLPAVVMISVVALFVGCQRKAEEMTMPPPTVVVAAVAAENVAPRAAFIGTVDAAAKATITARVAGYLESRLANEGDLVKKDQILFTIERTQYEAAVNQAEARLAQARANAFNAGLQKERAAALLRSASISQAQFDNLNAADATAQADVASAQAALEIARLNLEYTKVTSPISGKMGFVNFHVGETVGPASGPLTTVIASDPMYVVFTITDRQIQSIRNIFGVGNMSFTELMSKLVDLKIILSDGAEYPYTGIINFADNEIVTSTDSLRLRGVFANPEGVLTQGQTVTVIAEGREKASSVVVPQTVILSDIGGKYVLTVDMDGKVGRKNVTLGAQLPDGRQVIASGLNIGETIIISGLQKVRSGVQAHAVTQEEFERMMSAPQPQSAAEDNGGN